MNAECRKLISVTTSAGKQLHAFEGDEITTQIVRRGEYDGRALGSMRDVLGRIRPRTSLDVGANIGNHAVVIGELSQRLVAFEPLPFIFEVLRRNLQQNLGKDYQAFDVALSDEQVALAMAVSVEGNLGASSLEAVAPDGASERIEAVVGDDFLAAHGIESVDFIKIDVEGHEARALRGLARTIARDQPLIMIEWTHDNTLAEFARLDVFESVLSGYGALAITRTDSTKLFPRTLAGRTRRLWYRLFRRSWCLTDFARDGRYSNVYLVPPRFAPVLKEWPYFPALRR